MPERYDHFINGQYVAPVEGAYFESTDPATLETLYSAAGLVLSKYAPSTGATYCPLMKWS